MLGDERETTRGMERKRGAEGKNPSLLIPGGSAFSRKSGAERERQRAELERVVRGGAGGET